MTRNVEDLAVRVERLEQRLQERGMQRTPETDAMDPVDRLTDRLWAGMPFSAWLKISGPTFAVMALGLGALWNAQQATTRQILDLQESTTTRVLEVQRDILEMQRTTTDRILEMQRQILDLQREGRARNG